MARINFDFQQIDAFVAVAERGSFRVAAEQIHLSPPALSRRIGQLESSLGVRLFNRTTREVKLTGAGRAFLEHARVLLDGLEHAALGIGDMTTRQTGKVTLSCVPSAGNFLLPPVLRSFCDQYPAIQLRIIDESESVVLQSVISSEADFGLGFLQTRVPEVDFEPLLSDTFVLAVPRNHRWAKRRFLPWSELQGERLMTVARSSGNRQLMDDGLARAGLRPSFVFEVSRVSTLAGMVEAGLGLAVLPRLALPAAGGDTRLVGIPLREPVIPRKLGILRRHGVALHPTANILYGLLKSAFLARKKTLTG